jgi:hypothetical protein
MSRSYTSSPAIATMACSGTDLLVIIYKYNYKSICAFKYYKVGDVSTVTL